MEPRPRLVQSSRGNHPAGGHLRPAITSREVQTTTREVSRGSCPADIQSF